MYTDFYKLHYKPFSINPDPDFLFLSEKHRHALQHLQYGFMERMPIIVILGKVGTGKTILLRYLLRRLEGERTRTALIIQSHLSPDDFLRLTASEFEIPVNGAHKAEIYKKLHDFLIEEYMKKKRVFLLIDEAQNLPLETLEEIRMLTNVSTEKDSLIQIVLLGQPGLREKLRLPEMEQFLQRVAVSYDLKPLDVNETGQYIFHRLKIAGRKKQDIFTKEAIQEIYNQSKGIPRLINILCDSCLVYGFSEGLKSIDWDVVSNVSRLKKNTGFAIQDYPDHKVRNKQTDKKDIIKHLHNIEFLLQVLIKKVDAMGKHIKGTK